MLLTSRSATIPMRPIEPLGSFLASHCGAKYMLEESGQEYALVNIFFVNQTAPFLVRLVRGG